MKIRKLNPITNGTRHQIILQKHLLSKNNKLNKIFLKGQKNQSGRSSSTGRITVRHKGGGCKKLFRIINFDNLKYFGVVIAIFYDPNRSSFISFNYNFITNLFFNTLSTLSVTPGSLISCDTNIQDLRLGYRTTLKNIPTGSLIHSLYENNGKTSTFIRSAGTFGQMIQKDYFNSKIRLPSGLIIEVPVNSFSTIGKISNIEHNLLCVGKAGKSRLKGIRPSVRGIAMNPVDHPHGGRTNGGMPSVTPWGIPTKGKPTVKKKKL